MSKFFFDQFKRDVIILEVDKGQRCLYCKDKCPGFSFHAWRTRCNNCKCPRISHDIYHRDFVNVKERLGLNIPQNPNQINLKEMTLDEGYSWIPAGLNKQKIREYFSQIPLQKVPRLGTVGEKYRDRQLIFQLPKQDFSLQYCKFVNRDYQNNYYDFKNTRDKDALDIGYVKEVKEHSIECHQCRKSLIRGNLAIIAPKIGESVCWHPVCFVCCVCKELLVDLVYCLKDRKLYCERHYAEECKPRCSGCDELIFARECIKAMCKDWHTNHFCCSECDNSLAGQSFVIKQRQPYCIQCYERIYSNTCEKCGRIIGVDSKDLSYNNRHWHEACFMCYSCHEKLMEKPFCLKGSNIYCVACHHGHFVVKCYKCNEIFKAGDKKMEYSGKQWHEKCFCCSICSSPIGTESFIPNDNEIYCISCYEQKLLIKCTKCKNVIRNEGVSYRNEPWHKECFSCTNCGTSLVGFRFTSYDDKPYCTVCFREMFAKKCTVCRKPVTSVGGTHFISFENQTWHPDCFLCVACNKSLVGKGFISDGSDIICPECANEKFI